MLSIDAGLRYEITRRSVRSNLVDEMALTESASYNTESLNPSLHVRYAPTSVDQFRASVARTVRRPNYDLITPYEQEEEPADENVTRGNPLLRNERSWGVDVGYERKLGRQGILGVNFFYRDVTDVDRNRSTPACATMRRSRHPGTAQHRQRPGLGCGSRFLRAARRDRHAGYRAVRQLHLSRQLDQRPVHRREAALQQPAAPCLQCRLHPDAEDARREASARRCPGRSGATESNFDETINLTYDPDLEGLRREAHRQAFRAALLGAGHSAPLEEGSLPEI